MRAIRVHPQTLGSRQVLGDFPARFDARAVNLTCLNDGQMLHFAQWGDELGLQFALGWIRTTTLGTFNEAWDKLDPATPVPPLPDEPAGAPLDLLPYTDETLLRHFMRHSTSNAALLVYIDQDFEVRAFWRWRDAPGRRWAKETWEYWREEEFSCPLWAGPPLGPGVLCPATAPDIISFYGHYQRQPV